MHGYRKLVVCLLLLSSLSSYFDHGISSSDVQCLKDLKQSLIDPNILENDLEIKSRWNFTDIGDNGGICGFTGVECWHPNENRVLSLRLGNLGLEGPFPRGLELCASMTTLDLSGNNFSGPLSEHISEQMPYVSFLDLSNNSFSGGIPASIMNMTYLNILALQHNQFASEIANFRRSTFHASFRSTLPRTRCSVPSRTLCRASRPPTSWATRGSAGRRWTRSARRGSGCGYTSVLFGFGRCLSGFRSRCTGSTTRPSSGRRLGSSWGSWWPSTFRTSCSVGGSSPIPFVFVGDSVYMSVGLENAPAAFVGLSCGKYVGKQVVCVVTRVKYVYIPMNITNIS
uniref:Leucine-rich repeat-containing N-terminal plant-type domain-containing protein n=1 Tax=Aegilops tauschii subsp. strangulata TaxID=200361 RepID=A0A453G5P3_AEGTS